MCNRSVSNWCIYCVRMLLIHTRKAQMHIHFTANILSCPFVLSSLYFVSSLLYICTLYFLFVLIGREIVCLNNCFPRMDSENKDFFIVYWYFLFISVANFSSFFSFLPLLLWPQGIHNLPLHFFDTIFKLFAFIVLKCINATHLLYLINAAISNKIFLICTQSSFFLKKFILERLYKKTHTKCNYNVLQIQNAICDHNMHINKSISVGPKQKRNF